MFNLTERVGWVSILVCAEKITFTKYFGYNFNLFDKIEVSYLYPNLNTEKKLTKIKVFIFKIIIDK